MKSNAAPCMLNQRREHTTSRIVHGNEVAFHVLRALVSDSMWFTFEPLPDDRYNIRVKLDVAHRLDKAIQDASANVTPTMQP